MRCRELGENADALHAELALPLRQSGVSHVFLAGDNIRPLQAELVKYENELGVSWASTAQDLLFIVNNSLKSGDVVLIKGSNASGIGRIVKALQEEDAKQKERPQDMLNQKPEGA